MELGADEAVDYTQQDFSDALSGFDVVVDYLGGKNLDKSPAVLTPGGLAISMVGPPDPSFAAQLGKLVLKPVMALVSRKVRAKAKKHGVRFAFLFVQGNGDQGLSPGRFCIWSRNA